MRKDASLLGCCLCLAGLFLLLTSCREGSSLFSTQGNLNWPLFRGDPELSGHTKTPLPTRPTLLWTYKSDVRTVSSPVVKNGTTYWVDRRGYIRGVDLSGALVFEYNLKTTVEATPMIHDSLLFIGRIDGKMSAVSLTQSDTVWHYETMGQVSASPNMATFEKEEALVFGSYDNFLYCVNLHNGQPISRFETGFYLNGAAALCDNHVIFGGCDAWLRIIDCQTGLQTDSLQLYNYVPASPAIRDDYVYVGDYTGVIYEVQLEHGKIVQHKLLYEPSEDNSSFVSVPSITADKVFFLSSDRHLQAINRKEGTLAWKYLLKGPAGESSPVIGDNQVVVCTKSGIVSILNADNGALEWEYDTGEQIMGSPAIIKGHFFILTTKGTLFCFGNSQK